MAPTERKALVGGEFDAALKNPNLTDEQLEALRRFFSSFCCQMPRERLALVVSPEQQLALEILEAQTAGTTRRPIRMGRARRCPHLKFSMESSCLPACGASTKSSTSSFNPRVTNRVFWIQRVNPMSSMACPRCMCG